MADTDFPIILLPFRPEQSDYTSRIAGAGRRTIPSRDRRTHGQRIQNKFALLFQNNAEAQVAAIRERGGTYVQFKGLPDHDLITKSLEDLRKGIRLLNVSESLTNEQPTTSATVFVPAGQESHFIRKVEDYLNDDLLTEKGNPKNKPLINSIEEISHAMVEALWTDKPQTLPREDEIWCELWLRSSGNLDNTIAAITETCQALDITMGQGFIEFPERVVVPVLANRIKLQNILNASGLLAEIRRLAETAHFWLELQNKDQAEWVDDLLSRTDIDEDTNVSVLILDTGINRGHSLLQGIIAENHLFVVNEEWGLSDHDRHGTLMAGTVAYGDLLDLLNNNDRIALGLKIESGKILPPQGENERGLYGYYTLQLISQAELANADRYRIISMAVAENNDYDGRPSSWSGAIDSIASGAQDDTQRLIILSAGNVHQNEDYHYFDSNSAACIESPGQSWNALTVGAMTRKTTITEAVLNNYSAVAPQGAASPFTKTSTLWNDKWPIKPEIVLEGGNVAKDNDQPLYTEPGDLSLLSTFYNPTIAQFGLFNMTSASTALAANMAAKIAYFYPDFWPETVRGLMVHSAEWTEAMRAQFLGNNPNKQDYYNLLRACGYGEPVLSKAISCISNSMTMIMQHELQPYEKAGREKGYRCISKDMHFHELTLPEEMLLELGTTPVKLQITLSYFIEPGPGEIGWKDRYRYPSHGLRFDINNPAESIQQFKQRINSQTEEIETKFSNNSGRWTIGQSRDRGSIHSDIIETTAAQIATCKMIAIYPTIGWWRERSHLGKHDKSCRYSLIVSLETPDESVEIYNAISTEIRNRIQIESKVSVKIGIE